MTEPTPTPPPVPTQVRHPWRSTIRTGFQVLIGVISVVPFIVAGIDVPTEGWLAQVIAVAMAASRIMNIPQVSKLIERHFPGLSATGGTDTRA